MPRPASCGKVWCRASPRPPINVSSTSTTPFNLFRRRICPSCKPDAMRHEPSCFVSEIFNMRCKLHALTRLSWTGANNEQCHEPLADRVCASLQTRSAPVTVNCLRHAPQKYTPLRTRALAVIFGLSACEMVLAFPSFLQCGHTRLAILRPPHTAPASPLRFVLVGVFLRQ